MPLRMVRTYLALIVMSALFTLAGCTGGDSGAPVVVTVLGQGQTLSGVSVVLGDRNGKMKENGTTNSDGRVTFDNAPANATVTAAVSCLSSGATVTTYSLAVQYDVNGPVTLYVDGCLAPSVPPAGSGPLGTMTLNVTNAMSGITQNEVSTNLRLYLGYKPLITRQTITIMPYDLQSDGKLSMFVVGKDVNDVSIGYGYVLDQTFVDGMTINVTVDQPMSYLQYQISNLPSMVDYYCPGVYQNRTGKGGVWVSDCHDLSSGLASTTVYVPYIPGLGDQFLYSVSVSAYQEDGYPNIYYSDQYLRSGHSVPSLSNQSFDFSQALAVPNLILSGTDTPTPTVSWSGVDPDATTTSVSADFRLSSTATAYVNFANVSATRTSITFPELPDSLEAFRPIGVYAFSVETRASGEAYRLSSETYLKF